jgi:uncharacterized protein (UPF0333 family)
MRAQGSLEYLIIIAAILAIAAIVILFLTGAFGGSKTAADVSLCKEAAARCASEWATSVSPNCDYCDESCTDSAGNEIFPEAVNCCRDGKPQYIYEGATGCGTGPAPPNCGNGVIDVGEDCDGIELGGADCDPIAGTGWTGNLACYGDCTFDTTNCWLPVSWDLTPGSASIESNSRVTSIDGIGNTLYASTTWSGATYAYGKVWESVNGANWQLSLNLASEPPNGKHALGMELYQGDLYLGTGLQGSQLWMYDGTDWSKTCEVSDFDNPSSYANVLETYDDKLYIAGTYAGDCTDGFNNCRLFRYNSPGSCTTVRVLTYNTQALEEFSGYLFMGGQSNSIWVYNSTTNNYVGYASSDPISIIYDFEEYNGKLYAAGKGQDGIAKVYYINSWWDATPELEHEFTGESAVFSLAAHDGKLFAGTGDNGNIYFKNASGWFQDTTLSDNRVYSLGTHDGSIYAGTSSQGNVYVRNQ